MKKKTTIWTYFKRFLLIIIAFVVVIFVSVYFLGKYKAAGMTFNNEYPDDYWDNLEEKKHPPFSKPPGSLVHVDAYLTIISASRAFCAIMSCSSCVEENFFSSRR